MNKLAATSTKIKLNWHHVLSDFAHSIGPFVPWLVVVVIVLIVLFCPIPGHGPRMFQRRDPWRTFKYGARAAVFRRAGGRCEAPSLFVLGRCRRPAVEVDHIYPWSKGGATVLSNGQALCQAHNRHKANFRPPWWYVLGLERRRRSYFPVGEPVRVSAAMTNGERAQRQSSLTRRRGRRV